MAGRKKYRIFLSPPHQSGEELKYLSKALESNWLAPGGSLVKEFENKLRDISKRKYSVALNSGTAAIHLALKCLDIKAGDYVICQTFSFVATANPIAYLGAIPVFIDSESETWNMDPVLLEDAILDLRQSGILPKAIIYTHVYGNAANVDALLNISDNYNIPLIEDAAEALGTTIRSTSVGSFGNVSIFSFNGNKIITTSGGGSLLTDDSSIAERAMHLANQARDNSKTYLHTEVGYNYRMSNLSASLGLAQINYLEKWVECKRNIFQAYSKVSHNKFSLNWIDDNSAIRLNRWLSSFLVDPQEYVDKIQNSLHAKGIESRRFWKPLHLLNIFQHQKTYVSGVAVELFEKGICLPSGVGLKNEELSEIITIIRALD